MICEFCGKEHDGTYASGRFCSKSCAYKYIGIKTKEAFNQKYVYKPKLETRICPKCGKEFTIDLKKTQKKFCSRSCANGHIVTEETKQKISQSVQKTLLANSKIPKIKNQLYTNICVICGNTFETKNKNRKVCSNHCLSLLAAKTAKERGHNRGGGYRPNSGRGKCGWYKGIRCQSTYELAWVIYNLDHNVSFIRSKKVIDYIFDGKSYKYYPDFELEDGTIIEIKGYFQSTVEAKKQAVTNLGYKYKILYRKDLDYCFNYIYNKYGIKDITKLYDNNCGYYEKTCEVCGKVFKTRNINQKTCCRYCNGKRTIGNSGGRHLVNDKLKQRLIIRDPKQIEELLSNGWRIGIKFKE